MSHLAIMMHNKIHMHMNHCMLSILLFPECALELTTMKIEIAKDDCNFNAILATLHETHISLNVATSSRFRWKCFDCVRLDWCVPLRANLISRNSIKTKQIFTSPWECKRAHIAPMTAIKKEIYFYILFACGRAAGFWCHSSVEDNVILPGNEKIKLPIQKHSTVLLFIVSDVNRFWLTIKQIYEYQALLSV